VYKVLVKRLSLILTAGFVTIVGLIASADAALLSALLHTEQGRVRIRRDTR
jgi:hypothetical protein